MALLALALIPRPLVVVIAENLRPRSFNFLVETRSGSVQMSVQLDGFSHSSRARRAYCTCRHDGHTECHKYTQLSAWDEPWMAVAFVLAWLRSGILYDLKEQHRDDCPSPTEADILALKDEMPALLLIMRATMD